MIQGKKNAKLMLVGDGPEKDVLQDKIKKMELHNTIILTGKVPHDEITKYYSVMDILVYPREKMRLTDLVTPLKPLEAMAMGKIVIGSDVGGLRELITDRKDGFLFRAGDCDVLSKLLTELAFKKGDYQEISKAAIETVQKKHRWEMAVARYLPVYKRLLHV
jgi:glycosyltransferase involved in cell wall biosynthesis